MKIQHMVGLALALSGIACFGQEKPDRKPLVDFVMFAKISVYVHGEDNDPIEDAKLHIRFAHTNGAYDDGYDDFHVETNQDGRVVAESECTGTIQLQASKQGYYTSTSSYKPSTWDEKVKSGDKLLPWNPTVPIMLKKIGKGVPMYVRTGKRLGKYLPEEGMEYGFDLIEDDWVAPHGKGKVADLLVRADMEVVDAENFDLKMSIRFPNEGDGWIALHELEGIESEMKYPRAAPAAGYRNDPLFLTYQKRNPYVDKLPPGGHPYGYMVRLRSELDGSGKIQSAIYGKIVDKNLNSPVDERRLNNPIIIGGHAEENESLRQQQGCYFSMHYDLNPKPNDRSLEFDGKNKLAPEAGEGLRGAS